MSDFIYKGISTSTSSTTSYRDTILAPIISSDGPYGLNKVNNLEFDYKYSYTKDSISYDTASYLSHHNYNILAFRHRPWKLNIDHDLSLLDDFSLWRSDAQLPTSRYNLGISKLDIGELGFIEFNIYKLDSMNKEYLYKTIVFWRNSLDFPSAIPRIIGNTSVRLYGNLDDYVEIINTSLMKLGVSIIKSDDSTVSFSKFDNSKYLRLGIIIGSNEVHDDRTALRFFNDTYVSIRSFYESYGYDENGMKGTSPCKFIQYGSKGTIYSITDNEVSILMDELDDENHSVIINIPRSSELTVVPSLGSEVTFDSVILCKSLVSYPKLDRDYSSTVKYKIENIDPKLADENKDSIIVADASQTGVVISALNSVIVVRHDNKEVNIVNDRVDKGFIKAVSIGDEILEGDIIFYLDPSIEIFNELNTLTYSALFKLPSEYKSGQYFAFHGINGICGVQIRPNITYSESTNFINYELSGSKQKTIGIYLESNVKYSKLDISRQIVGIFNSYGYSAELNSDNTEIYIRRAFPFRIYNISSSLVDSPDFKMDNYEEGVYDAKCEMYDSRKILTIYSKYPTELENISVTIERNTSNFQYPEIGYNMTVNKYSSSLITASEFHTFNLSSTGTYSYKNIQSDIITIDFNPGSDLYDDSGNYIGNDIIDSGTYYLKRSIHRDISVEMMICDIKNEVIKPEDYTLFCDGGLTRLDKDMDTRDLTPVKYLDYFYEWWNKLKDHDNLMLISIKSPDYYNSKHYPIGNFSDFNYMYSKFKNVCFTYPNIKIKDTMYPGYVKWLEIGIENNQYTGDVVLSDIESNYVGTHKDKIMTVFYDGYRYVYSHNFMNSYVTESFPELILVLSRLQEAIYYNIDYQLGEESIRSQFNNLSRYLFNISIGILLNIELTSVKIVDHTCYLDVRLEFNKFRIDPIYLAIKINIGE